MLLEAADSHKSTAPMMMASDHFIREDADLRPENALLGNLTERQTRLPQKDTTANLINFYTQLDFWQHQPLKA